MALLRVPQHRLDRDAGAARKGSAQVNRCAVCRADTLHGISAVASLKLYTMVGVGLGRGGSPRHQRRGLIEADLTRAVTQPA